jgi:hypothetical protein
VFLRDGRVQIDNNLVENTIRPSAIGKKNWLFMGDASAGARAATFYTLIGNVHRAGINAEAYLRACPLNGHRSYELADLVVRWRAL